MLNVVTLVGRVVETPQLRVYDGDAAVTTIILAVQRDYKNSAGEVDTDFIRCVVWDVTARNACDYIRKGDKISIKGRLQSRYSEVVVDADGTQYKKKITIVEVVAEIIGYIQVSGNNKTTDKQYEYVE